MIDVIMLFMEGLILYLLVRENVMLKILMNLMIFIVKL